eukprot:309359-Pyramimonas_sp.AAC.1
MGIQGGSRRHQRLRTRGLVTLPVLREGARQISVRAGSTFCFVGACVQILDLPLSLGDAQSGLRLRSGAAIS